MGARSNIIEAAIKLFGENGYEGTSFQAMGDAVGTRKQSVFHYFKTKEELRKAILDDLLDHWQQKLPLLLAEASSGEARFASTIEAFIEFLLEDTNRAKVVIREMLDRPEESRALIREKLKPWITMLSNYIRLGKEAGFVKKGVDADSYIVLIMMMAFGATALGPVASAMTEKNNAVANDPNIKELIRIASTSYFHKKS